MMIANLFSQNKPFWSTTRNNDPSSQGSENPLEQNYGTFPYARLLHHSYATYWRYKGPLQAFSAYDLPIVEALVWYFHAAAWLPVQYTWIQTIKYGNYSSWPGLTYANTTRFCPSLDKTIMVHLVQYRQGVQSTKPKVDKSHPTPPPVEPPSEL